MLKRKFYISFSAMILLISSFLGSRQHRGNFILIFIVKGTFLYRMTQTAMTPGHSVNQEDQKESKVFLLRFIWKGTSGDLYRMTQTAMTPGHSHSLKIPARRPVSSNPVPTDWKKYINTQNHIELKRYSLVFSGMLASVVVMGRVLIFREFWWN